MTNDNEKCEGWEYRLKAVKKIVKGRCQFIPACKTERAYQKGLREALTVIEGMLSLTPAPTEQEPLAVLADRKGFNVITSCNGHNWSIDLKYKYEIGSCAEDYGVCEDTYSAAEQAARNYLMGLEDKV